MRASHAPHLVNEPHFVVFSKSELDNFVIYRSRYINRNTSGNIRRVANMIWDITDGLLTIDSLNALMDYYICKYESEESRKKCFNYTRAFLKYLFKIRLDTKIQSFLYLVELPRYRKEIKLLTHRIIIQEDIEKAISMINEDETLSEHLKLRYRTAVLFMAYTGQRPQTVGQLRVGQFKEAFAKEPYVLTVEAKQDKIRLKHYVPIHPVLVDDIKKLIAGMKDDKNLFTFQGTQVWFKKNYVPVTHSDGRLQQKDIRKFFEQKSDEIGFTDANKNFIMSHGVSSINWRSYKQFLPANVYQRYIKSWRVVNIQ